MRALTVTLTRSAIIALAIAGALVSGAGAAAVAPRGRQQPEERTRQERQGPHKQQEQQRTLEPRHRQPQPSPISVSVDSARPLSAAIDSLVEQFPWIVTYEDPRYLAPQDIADVTLTVRKDGRAAPKVLGPRGGPLVFEYERPLGGGTPDPAAVLDALIAAHNTYGYAAEFRLLQTGDLFHVVPRTARSAAGHMEEAGSLLDVRISIADRLRTLAEALEDIVQAVAAASGERVHVGLFPMNLAFQTKVGGGAANEPARAVLLRVFSAARLRLSWRLYYGPGTERYVLNVHIADPDYLAARRNR